MHMIIGLIAVGLSILFFLLGFIFFKTRRGFGKKLLIGGGIFFAIFIISAVTDPDFKDLQKKQEEEQAAAEEKTKAFFENKKEEKKNKEKEKEEKTNGQTIDPAPFEKKIPGIIEENKDQISDIKTIVNDSVEIKVMVKEQWWSEQMESKKLSFVTTTGKEIRNLFFDLDIVDGTTVVEVRYYSDEAGDLLAREKYFGSGYVIKR